MKKLGKEEDVEDKEICEEQSEEIKEEVVVEKMDTLEEKEIMHDENHENEEEIQEENKQNDENDKKINIELVSISSKINSKRNLIIIISVIAIVVITISAILGIHTANSLKKKELEEKAKQNEQEIIENQEKIQKRVPIYSEEAKIRMKNIYVPSGDEKVAYLTFDDGPSKNITPQILSILDAEDVKATFFVLGKQVQFFPELVKQAYESGHYIANHGFSHSYQNIYSSKEAVLDEYNRAEELIKSAINVPEYSSHLFRFPGGSEGGKYVKVKSSAKEFLEQNNIEYINWNALTNDAVRKANT